MSKNEKYLKPLTPKEKPFKYAVLDIESNGWVNFEMLGFYDGFDFHKFDTIEKFLDHCLSHHYRGYTFYAHNGGKFDFLFLLKPLIARNIPFKLITQGARITAIKITLNRYTYKFVDSYPILTASLEKLCATFAPERMKLVGTINFDREKVSKTNPVHISYLENDCISLHQIIKRYQTLPYVSEVGVKLTTASLAMAGFRTTINAPIRITSDSVQEFVRKSYAGGRVEIFRQFDQNFYRYDVNSLFPAQMLNRPIPLERIGSAHDAFQFGFHDVTVKVPDGIHIPILYHKINGKLYFPTGTFRGVYFSEELKLALSQGAKILKYHRGERFTESEDIFTEFIKNLYRIREENPGNNPFNFLAKTLMNSCYGKFAEREEKKSVERVDPFDAKTWPKRFSEFKNSTTFKKYGLITVENNRRPPHALVHIGAAITAWARVQMAENYYLKAGKSLIYTDTDSVDAPEVFPTSDKIGELKKEYDIKDAYYLLPKAYFLRLATPIKKGNSSITEIKKIKGFNSKLLDEIDFNTFKNKGFSSYERKIASFRTSLIRNSSFLSLVSQKRSFQAEYDKRVLTSDGTTRPWEISKGALR